MELGIAVVSGRCGQKIQKKLKFLTSQHHQPPIITSPMMRSMMPQRISNAAAVIQGQNFIDHAIIHPFDAANPMTKQQSTYI